MTFFFRFDELPVAANTANQLIEATATATEIGALAELAVDADRLLDARRKRCHALGFNSGLAGEIAALLAHRDIDLDDRRLCIECRHCRAAGCAVRNAWLPNTLQRCEKFVSAGFGESESAE